MHRELHGNIHVSDTLYGRYIDIQMPRKSVHTTIFQESETKKWFLVSQEFAQKAGLILDTPEIYPLGFLVIPEPIGSTQDKRIIVQLPKQFRTL
ncbi:MAG: hypothetical protein PHY14_01905 [Candidatus Gracilibacteria bacterium]|nr:hypothetical protein [Candidatus Gracilibacteria bacterium]